MVFGGFSVLFVLGIFGLYALVILALWRLMRAHEMLAQAVQEIAVRLNSQANNRSNEQP
jgi:hypothetical protein